MDEYKKQFVLNMLAYAVQREVSPEQLCSLSRVDLRALRSPEGVGPGTKQMSDLWLNAAQLTHDPLFGLHFGESLQLAALGVVGQIIQASKTVGEALTYAAGSIQLITDAVSMEVTRKDERIHILFLPTPSGKMAPDTLQQWMDFFMVFAIHEMDGLVLEKIKPLKATISGGDAHLEEYERVLRCRPKKNAASCLLEFDDRHWNEPIITANYELQQQLLSMLHKTTRHQKELLMSERIIDYLTANAYLGIASLDEIASNFNTSPRSLQRKLRDEGISFQQLADTVRKSIALHYLQSGDHPLKEISYLLGYNETSAFTRAFRRWTGKTPLDFKKPK
jgi:AraC-like DNA-binding protein